MDSPVNITLTQPISKHEGHEDEINNNRRIGIPGAREPRDNSYITITPSRSAR